MSDQVGGSSVMSSSQAVNPVISAVSGAAEDPPASIAAKQQLGLPSHRQGAGPEPAFGCVDWYLYPQELLEATG
jgi:hypothetical protein